MDSKGEKLQELLEVDFSTIENWEFDYKPNYSTNIWCSKEFGCYKSNLFSRCWVNLINGKTENLLFIGPNQDSQAVVDFINKIDSIFGTGGKYRILTEDIKNVDAIVFREIKKIELRISKRNGEFLRFYIEDYKDFIETAKIKHQNSDDDWEKSFEDYIINDTYYQKISKEYGIPIK